MTAEALLRAAREYVARGWTWGGDARDADGMIVLATSRAAICWCPAGALKRACVDNGVKDHQWTGVHREARVRLDALSDGLGIAAYNDWRIKDQEEALALMDRAIEEAR